MKAIEEKLQPYRFIRTHKSYIVAADKIIAIKRDIIAIGNTELPLSETTSPILKKWCHANQHISPFHLFIPLCAIHCHVTTGTA